MSSRPGNSYEYYQQVIYTVPLTLPLVAIPVALSINVTCGCIHGAHKKIFLGAVKLFSSGEEKQHYLQQEKPSRFILTLLFTKAILLVMFAFAVFLNDSLIADEIGCVSGGWDCFARSDGVTTRVTNCSNLGEFHDDDIECYRPAFEYSTALAEIGGIVFIVHIVINAYIEIYFSVRYITSRCLRIISSNLVVLFFGLLSVVGPILFAVLHVRVTVETLNFKMHNILPAIYYPLIYIVVTLTMTIRSKCSFDDYGAGLDPNTTVITVGGPPEANAIGTIEMGGATSAALTPPRASVQIAQGNKVHIINVV